jgi:hypothetical protein
MMRQGVLGVVVGALVALGSLPVTAQTRSPWELHDGHEVTEHNPLGLMPFTCFPRRHGDRCEYDVAASIPSESDPGWMPAPDGAIVGYSLQPSRVCQAPVTCKLFGDFTYFQTWVNVPAGLEVTEFTIAVAGLDDGARVTIYNSDHPGGVIVTGSFVYAGGSGTGNLAPYVKPGEHNRVVITQVDDCCDVSQLEVAEVVLNGQVVGLACQGTGDCGDGNACTQDVCNEDGTCSHPALSCDDGNACTTESCDPASGCQSAPVVCNDHNACTTDSCNPASGCQFQTVSCDDGNACTLDQCSPTSGCFSQDQCPDCSDAYSTVPRIWPPTLQFVSVGVQGVSDPQGQTASIRIDGIAQDEPAYSTAGLTCPDGTGIGTSTAQVRAERSSGPKGPGNGRVYHISFTATDPDGYACTGTVRTCVPFQGNRAICIDEGPRYDSLVCSP